MDKFARGPIRAQLIKESVHGSIRIDGPVNMSRGRSGMTLHPNTARKLAEWILATTAPAAEQEGSE